ncbi:MAG: WbuC family cupin fold metalloprotein [Leptospirales bacterium]|nr:WbuC family cupin fold metalloprotein [Leptospirales bacterium]
MAAESRPDVLLINQSLIQATLQRAQQAPRRRTNFNFHQAMEENPHRFLNVMLRGTYITPHRHLRPPKTESFLILSGTAAFFIFDDQGAVSAAHQLGSTASCTAIGIDIQPGVWHCLVVLSETAVCFEVKPGPYRASDDKEFAPWAPEEGSADCESYLNRLLADAGFSYGAAG